MTERQPTETTNLDQYGSPALPWSRADDALARLHEAGTSFLATVGPDARPHAAGIGAAWSDGGLFFVSGPGTRKSRNLAANPACTLSVSLPGIDLVFEGEAARVIDGPTLERLAAHYRKGGWPAEVEGDALTAPFTAPSGGPPPWHLYGMGFRAVYGVATTEPYGATRWRFDA